MSASTHDDADPPTQPGTGASARRSLGLNTVWAIGGTGFYHACQLGVLMLLAKLAGPEIQGHYVAALAYAMPVVVFFGFGLRGALIADAGNLFPVGSYLALRNRLMIGAAIVLAATVVWKGLTDTAVLAFTLLGVSIMRIAWSLAEVGWGTYHRRERLDLVALAHILRGFALLAPFAILLFVAEKGSSAGRFGTDTALVLATFVVAGAFIAIYLFFDRPRIRDVRHWDLSTPPGSLRKLTAQTFPLGVVALIIVLCESIPRWVIEHHPDGEAQLGYFGSLAYITLAGNLIVIQAANAAANRLSLYYQQNLRAFLWLVTRLLALAGGIGVGVLVVALLIGQWLLSVLYTPAYAQYLPEFKMIVGANCLMLLTNVFGTTSTQMRLFWVQVPAQIITLAATVIAAVLLIDGENLVRGGAQTLLVRSIVQFGLYAPCIVSGIVLRDRVLGRAVVTAHDKPK